MYSGAGADLDEGQAAVLAAATAALKTPSHRLVMVGEEAGIQLILRAMTSTAPLRDRVMAVVSLGGLLGGLEQEGPLGHSVVQDWMATWFQHKDWIPKLCE